jgi:hypothetical protein
MRLPGEITKSLRKTARNASILGIIVLAGLLGLLITSRWFPSVALVELWWPFEIVGWLAVLITAALTYDSLRAVFAPHRHGAVERLREHGELGPIFERLTHELGGPRERYGAATFLASHMLVERWASYAILPIDWIAWAYAKETEHRKYGITVRRSYELFCALRSGEVYSFPTSSSEHENQLLCCRQRSTVGMVSGYDEELEKLWDEDHNLVVGAVERLAAAGQLEQGPIGLLAAIQVEGERRLAEARDKVEIARMAAQLARDRRHESEPD